MIDTLLTEMGEVHDLLKAWLKLYGEDDKTRATLVRGACRQLESVLNEHKPTCFQCKEGDHDACGFDICTCVCPRDEDRDAVGRGEGRREFSASASDSLLH